MMMYWTKLTEEEKALILDKHFGRIPLCLAKAVRAFLHDGTMDEDLYPFESYLEAVALTVSNLTEIDCELAELLGKYPIAYGLLKDEHRRLRKFLGLTRHSQEEEADLLGDMVEADLLGGIADMDRDDE